MPGDTLSMTRCTYLVKDRAQRFGAVPVGERDDVHVVAGEEVAAEPDRFAVEAGNEGSNERCESEYDDDRRHCGRRARARDHPRQRLAEALELVGDFAHAALAGFTVDDEVGCLDADPVSRGWKHAGENQRKRDGVAQEGGASRLNRKGRKEF